MVKIHHPLQLYKPFVETLYIEIMFKDSRSDREAFDVPFCESCFSYRTSACEGKLGLEEERPDLLRNAIESKDGLIYDSR